MDHGHGGDAARLTTEVESAELGMARAVRGNADDIGSGSGAFDGQLGTAAAAPGSFRHFDLSAVAGRGVVPVATEFHFHRAPGPDDVAYPNDIGAAFCRQPGPVHVVLIVPQLPGRVVLPVHGNYSYHSALQPRPRPGARRGVVHGDLLASSRGGGAVYNWDYALHPRLGAGHGEVLVDQLPDDGGHGEALVGLLRGGVDAVYDNYTYYVLQSGAGHGEVHVDHLPDGARHGEAFVGLLPGGVDAGYDNYGYDALQLRSGPVQGEVSVGRLPGGGVAVHDDYGYYYPLQPHPGAGRGEVFVGPLTDDVGQTLLGTGSADELAGALRDPNLGSGYDGSLQLADDLGAGYDNRGMVAEHLHRLLPFAGIGACSVAINGIAAAPGSPTAAINLFALLLGGLFLVILHVLRV